MRAINLLIMLIGVQLVGVQLGLGAALAQDKGTLDPKPLPPLANPSDPATPAKWVPYVKKGIEDWQVAFEAAGFRRPTNCRAHFERRTRSSSSTISRAAPQTIAESATLKAGQCQPRQCKSRKSITWP